MCSCTKIFRIITVFWFVLIVSSSPVLADDVTVTDCTASGLQTAWTTVIQNGGGTLTFDCGGATTIPVSATLNVDPQSTSLDITVDGGGLITLDGQNARQIFYQRTWGYNSSTLTLQNLTITRGRSSGSTSAANGGAIESVFGAADGSIKPVLNIDNVTFSSNASVLSGSSGDFGGGAIYSQGGSVNVTDSAFTSNTATGGSGAAIHILQSGLAIANTTFADNVATNQGGSIYVDGLGGASGVFSIVDSSFTGSRSYYSGGAIYVNMYENTSAFTVDRTSFIDNGVNGGDRAQGGAICGGSTTSGSGTGNAIITITNSLFSNNFVDLPGTADGSGGAINFNQRAQVTIANSTFDSNRAEGVSYGANGGALVIINNTTQFQIINSTITNNFAGWAGGGIAASNGILRNTIIAYNTADNGTNDWDILQQCAGELVDGGNNLQYPPRNANPNYYNEITCLAGKSAIAQMGLPDFQDPLLDSLADNGGPTQTRSLQASSPAIDYGDDTVCAGAYVNNLDQRGITRPVDGDGLNGAECDTGAFEYVSDQSPLSFNLTAPVDSASLIGLSTTLSWAPAPFATEYRLLVDNDSGFNSPAVDVTTDQLSVSPTYLGVGTFYWNVEASNVNGSVTSSTYTFTLNSPPDAIPTRNFFTTSTPTLTWNRVTGVTEYEIQVDSNSTFTSPYDFSTTVPGNTLSVTPSALPDGLYYWRVRGNNGSTVGAWSIIDSFVVDVP